MKNIIERMFLAAGAGVAGFGFTVTVAAAPAAPAKGSANLADYRTVADALTTQIVKTNALLRAGQTTHLGLLVAPDKRGRLAVEDVEVDSPAA